MKPAMMLSRWSRPVEKSLARNPVGAAAPHTTNAVRTALWATYLRSANRADDAERALLADPVATRLLTAPVQRADASPGSSTTVGFGDELVGSAVRGYLSDLSPLSAAAKLFAAGERFDLAGREKVSFPINSNIGTPTWVAEDDEIPVVSGAFTAAELGPTRKISFIVPLTRELWKRSNGRVVFDAMLKETVAGMLDAAVFSDMAASDAAHRGLRDGVVPLPSNGFVAADIAALLQGVVDLGGGGRTAIIMNPREHAIASVQLPQLPVPLWASRGLPAGTAIAVDLDSFASGVGELEVLRSESAVIHMSDQPLPIVSGAPVTADPVRSAFQTASIFIRLILDCAFVSRGNRVATMEGISW